MLRKFPFPRRPAELPACDSNWKLPFTLISFRFYKPPTPCSTRNLCLKVYYLCVSMIVLNQHIDQIKKLCELNKVSTLFAFGSVTTDDFNPDSDIDLVVEIDDNDPISYADKYFNLKFQLEEILNRQIDLLEQKAIRNRFLKSEIERTKVHIYGKRSPTLA